MTFIDGVVVWFSGG